MAEEVRVTRVLVVDDERQFLRAPVTNLRARGYDVRTAATGDEVLRIAEETPPDVVVLDLGLPGIDGLEVVRALRRWTSVPIIMLSVRGGEIDKVAALDAGADDYVTKPFGMNELVARLRAAVRRAPPAGQEPVVTTDDFAIDLGSKKVVRDGAEVHLTPTEWGLIEELARQRGKLVSQRHLLQEVWGPAYEKETNYLRVYMAGLRRKLERDPSQPRYLITEPGVGYRFQVE
jgi:two-component system KDP operon response regulator KdpE